ncbi:hypothetical protein FKP32DRAFT_1297485 [Trametes sanguinea]|nr:hypothetical protein FKP32DRAFT_1297485 [Trametes sanguinea]
MPLQSSSERRRRRIRESRRISSLTPLTRSQTRRASCAESDEAAAGGAGMGGGSEEPSGRCIAGFSQKANANGRRRSRPENGRRRRPTAGDSTASSSPRPIAGRVSEDDPLPRCSETEQASRGRRNRGKGEQLLGLGGNRGRWERRV